MATNLKIEGNFLVLSDNATGSEYVRYPRSSTTFKYTIESATDYFTFTPLGTTRNFTNQPTTRYDFTDLIDNRTGSAFTSVAELTTFLSLNLGGVSNPIFSFKSTFCDYKKTSTSTLPTTWAKLDYSGATLVYETEDLFNPVNSRIKGMEENQAGLASISMEVDAGGGGSNKWVELQLRGFDSEDNELFAKRGTTVHLVKGVADHAVNKNLEFYFGAEVSYFEVWYRGSSALDFSDPEITVIKF